MICKYWIEDVDYCIYGFKLSWREALLISALEWTSQQQIKNLRKDKEISGVFHWFEYANDRQTLDVPRLLWKRLTRKDRLQIITAVIIDMLHLKKIVAIELQKSNVVWTAMWQTKKIQI